MLVRLARELGRSLGRRVTAVDTLRPCDSETERPGNRRLTAFVHPCLPFDPTKRFLTIAISRFSAALFVRRFRCGRGGEFFEARIISERIEHRIEPEQRRR
jgi:hypothetical protein